MIVFFSINHSSRARYVCSAGLVIICKDNVFYLYIEFFFEFMCFHAVNFQQSEFLLLRLSCLSCPFPFFPKCSLGVLEVGRPIVYTPHTLQCYACAVHYLRTMCSQCGHNCVMELGHFSTSNKKLSSQVCACRQRAGYCLLPALRHFHGDPILVGARRSTPNGACCVPDAPLKPALPKIG